MSEHLLDSDKGNRKHGLPYATERAEGGTHDAAHPVPSHDSRESQDLPPARPIEAFLRGWQGGIVASCIIGSIGLASLVLMMGTTFSSKEIALFSHLALGIGLGGAGAVYAAWSRSMIGSVLLLIVCVLFVWGSLLGGVGAWFTTWQTMPNAPDDAFNDTGIIGIMLIGWLPAKIYIAITFATARLIFHFSNREL